MNPGTSEGGHFKPQRQQDRMNSWCARECERCLLVDPRERRGLEVRDYSQRVYNQPWKHKA